MATKTRYQIVEFDANDKGQTGGKMRAALYARVSTNGHGQDCETQLRELRHYAQFRKWDVTEFADTGWSGAKESRPQLDTMLAGCRRGKFDVVLVAALDRFARSTKQLVLAMEEFNRLGIQFVSLRENVDTTSAQGRLVFQIFSAISEFERELIRARVRSGIARAQSQGKHCGRPGLDADAIAQLRHELASGRSLRAAAKAAGVSVATAHKYAQDGARA